MIEYFTTFTGKNRQETCIKDIGYTTEERIYNEIELDKFLKRLDLKINEDIQTHNFKEQD